MRPTLEEIRHWPATVPVPRASEAFGWSKSHCYELIAQGEFPAKTIRAGGRIVVVTASILRQLGGDADAA